MSARDVLPVRLFEASELSDVIVIAGPNGVGKSRLIQQFIQYLRHPPGLPTVQMRVAATCDEEVAAWQGKKELNLADPADVSLFLPTLQHNRSRQNWRSSIINFESDRSIRNVQPFAPTWDIQTDEQVGWDHTLGFMRDRFYDTLHSMFRIIEAQHRGISSRATQLKREGHTSMALNFTDPMAPFKETFARLLAPKSLVDPSPRTNSLQYLEDGTSFDISSLSSGEREVLNIAFDFQLRNPHDCIVFFDEPELHLHPELSYRLLQALQEIGENNQFIFATHSPDIISASLDRSVIFLSPPQSEADNSPRNQAILVSEGDSANRALQLLGQSIGIIALGRKIVLIEGTQASLDKQTYGSILRNAYPSLVLVPSGGRHIIESFEAVYDSVLSRSIWGVEFFMLCDGDSAPAKSEVSAQAIAAGRLALLPRYHLENYFLDEKIWAEALSPLDAPESWTRDSDQVRERLRGIARSYVSYAVALRVAASVRYSFGNIDIMPADCHGKSLEELCALFQQSSSVERIRFDGEISGETLISLLSDIYTALLQSLDDAADDQWKISIPGRPILNTFASASGLKPARAKRLYLIAAEKVPSLDPFSEVRSIFDTFAFEERSDDAIHDMTHSD